MKTIKATLLAALLLFFTNMLMAQDKYEYAALRSHSGSNTVTFITGTESKSIELEAGEYDFQGLLKEATRLSVKEGWDVFNNHFIITGGTTVHTFYLRKKVG